MICIKFVGTGRQLRAFLEYLRQRWSGDRKVVDLPWISCQ